MGGGGKGGNKAASKQADAQLQAQREALQLQEKMWNQTMQNLAPYMGVGPSALQGMSYLTSPGGRQDFLSNYYNSGEFKDASQQARNQQLAAAEATGGLGSSATSNALASIAPQLGQQALAGQYGMLGDLMQTGMSAATGQANMGNNYANTMSQLQQGMGAINAGRYANQQSGLGSAISGGVGGALGGAGLSTALGMSGPWGAAIGGGLGILGSLF